MMKFTVLAGLTLLLSACAIPTALVLTSAVDGVTYLGSGKSLGSHTLSAAADKDCSLLFGITRGKFCIEKKKSEGYARRDAGFVVPKDEPAVSDHVTTPAAVEKSAMQQPVLEPRFFDFDHETPPVTLANAKSSSKGTSAPAADRLPANQTQWTLVLGSFVNYRSAIDLARRVKPEPALVTTIVVQGAVHYRVSTRPLRRDQDVGQQLNIAALKLDTVKLMPVCPARVHKDNCVALDRPLAVQQVKLP